MASQGKPVLTDCTMLEIVRTVVRTNSQSELARARSVLDSEQSQGASLPQFSALFKALPGHVDSERELEVLMSVPLGVAGQRQGQNEASMAQMRRSTAHRRRSASLLVNALSAYYELVDVMLALEKHAQTRNHWETTLKLLSTSTKPEQEQERDILKLTCSIEYDNLVRDLETLLERRVLLEERLEELADVRSFKIEARTSRQGTRLVAKSEHASRSLDVVQLRKPQVWKDVLAGVQLQGGFAALRTSERSRLGYFVGVSYQPVRRSVLRSLRNQARLHQLEREEMIRSYESNRRLLARHRHELLLVHRRFKVAQQARHARRMKEQHVLEQDSTGIELSKMMHRIGLIRSIHQIALQESRDRRNVRISRLKYLKSAAVLAGLEGVECVRGEASEQGRV